MLREVKKRTANVLKWDVSYKEAKQLSRFRGGRVFRGLVTATNELGEVRLQFHVVTDGHDQMVGALTSLKDTLSKYGYTQPKIVFTDKPSEDTAFFHQLLPSVAEFETTLNENAPKVVMQREVEEDTSSPCHIDQKDYSFLSTAAQIEESIVFLRKHLETMEPCDRRIVRRYSVAGE